MRYSAMNGYDDAVLLVPLIHDGTMNNVYQYVVSKYLSLVHDQLLDAKVFDVRDDEIYEHALTHHYDHCTLLCLTILRERLNIGAV